MDRGKRIALHVLLTVLFLGLGVLAMATLMSNRPEIVKKAPPVAVPLVRTLVVSAGPKPIVISAEGTVKPLKEIQVIPQVAGKVLEISPSLVNGGTFKKGDTLIRIDPADYRLAITLAKASIKKAESQLSLIREEAASARQEWRKFFSEQSKDKTPPPLAVKKPQVASARAQLDAAKADLTKARLNLKRTRIGAPFAGRVVAKQVDIGQYVTPGQPLATIFSTDAAEIVVPLEDRDLAWFDVPGFTPGDGPGAPATIKAEIAGRRMTWTGRVVRTEGKIDERTRMIHVVVRVDNPYEKRPPLAMGLFVTVEIKGLTLQQAAIIPRSALHDDHTVWVLDKDNRLRFRAVEIALIKGGDVWVRHGLANGERVVLSDLKVVTDGMKVRAIPGSREEEPA